MVKKALITGITGQDASYLSEHLLEKGYEVHGTMRRISTGSERWWRVSRRGDITIHSATLEAQGSLVKVVRELKPDECYHLAAQSDVTNSFHDEFSSLEMNIKGTHYLLDALWTYAPHCKFYFAGSSEMFGGVNQTEQDEATPFNPRSPYAISKVAGFHLTKHYRESRKMFACSGILFNHESPRRGEEFVTRKIAMGVAAIKAGRAHSLRLGDMSPTRDWGYAPEYVAAMHLMLQQDVADDYVIATNETHSVLEFVEHAFGHVDLDWRKYVVGDLSLMRPCEVMCLKGNYRKAKEKLGWEPKVKFSELVQLMVSAEIEKTARIV